MNFNYSLKQLDTNNLELILSGFLEESAKLPEKLELNNINSLYIDLEDLRFINSGGIKLWVNFSKYLEKYDDLKIIYKNCHRVIIDQFNLIDGMIAKNATILSLYIPVFCSKCEKSYEVFQLVNQLTDDFDSIIGRVISSSCQSSDTCKRLELDIFPDIYFKFVKK